MIKPQILQKKQMGSTLFNHLTFIKSELKVDAILIKPPKSNELPTMI